ncbi:heme biosynthesis HemY N-terminal domain-containing protein [Geminicoccaceae bacterium 1502E]|nr:heme biosynthesis HemY N-terminal domain-containing protein [Geminicoccaceae bacterium 1502E]
MIRTLIFIAIVAAAAAGVDWLASNPGMFLVEWRGYRFETSVGIALLGVGLFAVLVTILFEILRWLGALPRRVRDNRRHKREVRGYRELASGLMAAAAGDRHAARLHSRQSAKLLPEAPGVLLLSAQTAQLEGNDEEAGHTYRRMLEAPETELAGLRGLLAQAAKADDRAEGLELARRAYARNPGLPWVVTTFFELLTRHERWSEALALVDRLESLKLLDAAEARAHRTTLNYLVARDLLREEKHKEAYTKALKAFRLTPAFAPAPILAAEAGAALGHKRRRRRLLEQAWELAPHPDIARAYADLVPGETPNERRKRFERLRKRRPRDAETHMVLAEVALAAQQADAAKVQIEMIPEDELTARACRIMAEAERALGADAAKVDRWESRAHEAKADPAWICEDTGETMPAWTPFSRRGRFNQVSWGTPLKVAQLVSETPATLVLARPAEPAAPAAAPEPRTAPAAEAADGEPAREEKVAPAATPVA